MGDFLKRPLVSGIIVLIVAAAFGAYLYLGKEKKAVYEFIIAERGEFIQQVSVTGEVKPVQSVELAFEKGGRVANVYFDVGDRVKRGSVLVVLESAELNAEFSQAQANLKAKEAKLEELKRGTRPEEIKVQEVKVANAAVAVGEAKKNLTDNIQDAYTKSDDAVRSKADQLFTGGQSQSPELDISISDAELESKVEFERALIENTLNLWSSSLEELGVLSDLGAYSPEAESNLNSIKSFLNNLSLALNSVTETAVLSQATIDGWKSGISAARANINTAISNLQSAGEKLKTAESNFALAKEQLVLKKAGSTPEEIKTQEAAVEEAQAKIANIKAQISKATLRSPISGIMILQEAKEGEIVSAGEIIVSVMSEGEFEMEANVAEADIAKIEIGDSAKVTLDAYGSDILFEAVVSAIEPAETIIEGVPTYKTTLQFIEKDKRIRSGMTANIEILTDKRDGIIAIPGRAVATRGGKKFAKVVKSDEIVEVEIKTGVRDSFGNIEVTEGISEGDKVVVFIKK
jgi:RND family efflux transporter MFP subunit